jgi:carbonic anhydrase
MGLETPPEAPDLKDRRTTVSHLNELLDNNRAWAKRRAHDDPEFFARLTHQQTPEYLWIGCSDSRVPANEIVGLLPGELFVHRNVANLVVHTDLNCLSVLQYAVDVLRVRHIILCGHYRCGGVTAAVQQRPLGLIDNWLRHLEDIATKHAPHLPTDESGRIARLGELNVLEQALNTCRTTIVQDAWRRGQDLRVHGVIYDIADGLLQEIGFGAGRDEDVMPMYERALEFITQRETSS